MENIRYHKGSASERESIIFDVKNKTGDQQTYVVDVRFLLDGFPYKYEDENKKCRDLSTAEKIKLLQFLKKEREKIINTYPVKTYKGWYESGIFPFEDYCFPGDKVDKEMVDAFINGMPPTLMLNTCMQAGEPYSITLNSDTGKNEMIYITFHKTNDSEWIYDGCCFYGQNKDMNPMPNKLDKMIEKMQQELKKCYK